ncbi:MAG: immune inhibitor A [candidate division Zixibacteria bacterium]|nr:immune inhibitor A [candidate division Zixibacteria bacterium]
MKFLAATIIPLLLIILFEYSSAGNKKPMQIRVSYESKTQFVQLLKLNPDIIKTGDDYFELVADDKLLDSLQKLGYETDIIHVDLTAFYRSGLDPTLDMGGYKTLSELNAYLDGLVADHPDIVSDKLNIGTTIEGRTMWAVKISDNPDIDEEGEPELLYTACIHAREVITPEVLLYFMDYLTDNYSTDPEAAWLVNNRQLWFIVMVNPDGYYYNELTNPEGGGLWRKNRRDNGNDEYGVDLNRNFGYAWGFDNMGSSSSEGSETYRGAAPFSEPETQNIRDFVEDHDFVIALFYHSAGREVIWPWGYRHIYTEDEAVFAALGDSISAMNGYTDGPIWQIVYLSNGCSDDWLYGEQSTKNKIISLTIEVGSSWWPSLESIDGLVSENLGPNLFLARIADRVYVPNPPAAPNASVTDSGYLSDYDIFWQHDDTLNPAMDFNIEEFRDFQVTTDPANSFDAWVNHGFTLSTERAFSTPTSYFSGTGDLLKNYIQSQVPYNVQDGDTLRFYTFYHIELDWDYAYVKVSIDGVNFSPIPGNITTDTDPHENNRGHGITGESLVWIQGLFDLSAFTGQEVFIRFSFETDSYEYYEGMYIDDIYPKGVFGYKRNYFGITDTVLSCQNRPTDEYYYKVYARDAEDQLSRPSNLVHVSVEGTYLCGDINCSGGDDPDISDITRLIDYLYLSHNPLCNPQAADINSTGGEPDISDITALISFLYLSGPDPKC